jgi:hypothetical protein
VAAAAVTLVGERRQEEVQMLTGKHGFVLGLLALAGIGLVLTGLGCGGDSTKPDVFDPPPNVVAVNGDLTVTLGWGVSPDESGSDFQQYDIYRGTSSLVSASPSDLASHKIASVTRGITTYTDHFAANGVRDYYHVRSEKVDGTLSNASNEVIAAGRFEGTGLIIEEFVSTGNSGFDFSAGATVALGSSNADRFTTTDVYLGTMADNDASSSALALKSPELLARLGNDEWISKDADVKDIGTDFDITTTQTPGAGWANLQQVTEGHVYAIKTPTGNYAKMKILDIEGLAGSRKITFKYAYQPTAGLVLF